MVDRVTGIPEVDIDLVERINKVFSLDPNAPAIEFVDHWYSYHDLRIFWQTLNDIVAAATPGPGVAVGILVRNRPAHFAALLGSIVAGNCVVTFNPLLPTAPLCEDIEELRCPILVADEEDWSKSAFHQAARNVNCVGVAISTSNGAINLRLVEGCESLSDGRYREPMPGIAVEMLSSGTTGKPKRIKLAYKSLSTGMWSGAQFESRDPAVVKLRSSTALQWMPLVHIGGLLSAIYALYNGRRFALLEHFDLDKWHSLLLRHRPRFANFPPTAIRMLLDRNFPKDDFSSLIAIRSGTAPLDADLALEFEQRYDVPVLEGYGATEFAGGAAGWTLADHRKFSATKRKSVGRANPGVQLRIVDTETFEPLGVNQTGLLEVKTRQVDEGRHWVRTTDLASIDGDGFLYIHGRADNAIMRGGFKIRPEDIENTLRNHPSVFDASVVALPDKRLGQVPVAAVELKDNAPVIDIESLDRYMRERLKPYEIPAAYRIVDELPRTPSMKVSQPAVRALFTDE